MAVLCIALLVLIGTALSAKTDDQRRAFLQRNRINAKLYEGFQPLEAALIPEGSYLQLNDIPSFQNSPTTIIKPLPSQNSTVDDSHMNDLIDSIISAETMAPGRSVARSVAVKRWLAGIVPLRASRIPMGIFIPEDMAEGGRASEGRSVRAKITAGVRKVFSKLRRISVKRATFNYVSTFNGLSPLEAVFIPRGYFIALASLSSYTGSGNSTKNGSKYVAGIEPLDSVLLAGGVFIPHRMSGLPDLPSQILVPTNTTGRPGIGVVATLPPDTDGPPNEPDFPEKSTTAALSAAPPASDCVPGPDNLCPPTPDCTAGPNVIPGCTTASPALPLPNPSKPIVDPTVDDIPTAIPNVPPPADSVATTKATGGMEPPAQNQGRPDTGEDPPPPPPVDVTNATATAKPGPVRPSLPVNVQLLLPPGTQIEHNPPRVDVHYLGDDVSV